MKTKLSGIFTLLLAFVVHISFAQEKSISGNVTDPDGLPLPGVNILIQNTTHGTQTDFDGNYDLKASVGQTLVFTYIGFKEATRTVGSSNTINLQMKEDAQALDEVVVTALGISREKKSLGYATQELDNSEVQSSSDANFINNLSGKVSGLSIRKSNNMGGSSNIIIRGATSLTGNNQALFVVDGVPISNSNTNTTDQKTGAGGYDFGNAASDINPSDIESVTVLKGAAATALYGSRASTGAIVITTKKGKSGDKLGITINSSVTIGKYDKSTFAEYQKEYGQGYYGNYFTKNLGRENNFRQVDVDGDGVLDNTTYTQHDASIGEAFNGQQIYQWDAYYPQLSNYKTLTEYKYADNDPSYFFQNSATYENNIAVSGGGEGYSFRGGFGNLQQEGILPNSLIRRNSMFLNSDFDLSDKLKASFRGNFIKTDGTGRYGTGYNDNNLMGNFRQWWATNADLKDLKNAYSSTGENITWNLNGYDADTDEMDLTPAYWDNPYWTRYENASKDTRNRFIGSGALSYDAYDWLNLTARASVDTYASIQEEFVAVGSHDIPAYERYNYNFSEFNYDFLATANKHFGDNFNITGLLGANYRQTKINSIRAITNGGLVIPNVYALSNSVNLIESPDETETTEKVYGIFASASLGYKDMLYLDVSGRNDVSSTLPDGDNSYFYPSVSTSFLFSKLVDKDWMSLGKLRLNYAEVGSSAPTLSLQNVYIAEAPFGGSSLFRNPTTYNNADLKPERTRSYEAGLEMRFLQNRVGFDFSYYNTESDDLIVPVSISTASGGYYKYFNTGKITNEGFEVSANFVPIQTNDFKWNMILNWSKNENTVNSLFEDNTNLVIASLQGGVSINATVGQPYGTIRGSAYDRDENGNKLIDTDTGGYQIVDNQVIGDANADWMGGITNQFTYKNLSFSFLIDIKQGGDVFSLDQWYGQGSGLYPNTAGLNDLGNPQRASLEEGGGVILPGVKPDGTENDIRLDTGDGATSFVYGYYQGDFPNEEYVYDASYVKLREATLTYKFPEKLFNKLDVSCSLIGRNLWIIHKNLPMADPEDALSSGNVQAYQSGAYPSVKEYGFNLKIDF
ncbi:SusC/RagA family TonB-linked outer membrane protein [Maribacter sp. ANRC-HE7]|uniref:SusC/RagA family TonB-linked outer membrane protein n=1 Tax=Maribacter aquimaris TaxID=2737171 RepID=A0ABR7V4S8_9FLAO|nr:SusC/RagA family TonB-linked outer membrane protein [Maribacter aquimaris]MBD0778187.1 SusC/RagA family TonB-linked outer membrane protein [Maribacter aquimaris]